MKNSLLAFLAVLTFISCKQGPLEKTLTPRVLAAEGEFNGIPKSKSEILTIVDPDSNGKDAGKRVAIKFRDTTITIEKTKGNKLDKFADAMFINSQKTAVLVQTTVEPLFYIINIDKGAVEVVDINRPSGKSGDRQFLPGMEALTRTSFVINNDYIVTAVNGSVHPIKRQNPEDRIRGQFFAYSKDKKTLVFLTDSALYQVCYITDETFTQPLTRKVENMYNEVQQNYTWVTNQRGTSFLKKNADDNRIVDISEFKH